MNTPIVPQNTITIPLTKGYSAIVDEIDADLAQLKWCVRVHRDMKAYGKRALVINGKHKTFMLHRVIFERMIKRELGSKEFVDHIDRDGLNNRRSNLRLATYSQNSSNSKRHKDNSVGYKGVSKNGKGFLAEICVNSKRIKLGTYKTPEEAYAVFCEATIKYRGEFARFE